MKVRSTRRELLESAAKLVALGATVGSSELPSDAAGSSQGLPAQVLNLRDSRPDTWVCTDRLNRSLPLANEVGPPRQDRTVGIFYFLWHGAHGTPGPYDNTKLIKANPSAPAYGPVSAFHWWGEPSIGYFRSDDPWVAHHNLMMLANAGVDVLLIDVTNGFTYHTELETLCNEARTIVAKGGNVPRFAFVTHAATFRTVTDLYDFVYKPRRYSELWFHWEGKPLILGDISAKSDSGNPLPPEIAQFFTWRYSWAWDPGEDKWEWIDTYPQRFGWHLSPSTPEEAPAAVASHPDNDIGRSWHSGSEPPLDSHFLTAERHKGIYFGLQLSRLLQIDPQFAFLTGWNEWVAQRFVVAPGQHINFMGKQLSPGQTFFVDNYNEEFSRDVQPMKGGYGDLYYLQMVSAIRRYKGARSLEVSRDYHNVRLSAPWHRWNGVRPVYIDAEGDVKHRDWDGWGNLRYKDHTGRNDIVEARVASNSTHVWFYVRTANRMSPHTDRHWMQLLLSIDAGDDRGWEGYNFVVNSTVISDNVTTLKRLHDGYVFRVPYRSSGSHLAVEIPRRLLGIPSGTRFQFDFHWVDNVPVGGDIDRFWTEGDSAPDGRFNFRYIHE